MTTTDQDARALTYLARRLRDETHGCRQWDEAGTWAKVSELIGQNLAISIERVLCHAIDPEARTPGAITRPFTPPKPSEQPPPTPTPPRRDSQCNRCGGELPNCACTREHLAATYDDEATEIDLNAGRELLAQIKKRKNATEENA